ncbi:HAD family hydrolase [Sulfurospirillum arcachonense]|uniref:HAD family hydrolase n=1 Tax=Sulfurospirillum arcachonense TaxID=57666 RepID=UPI00046A203C|nr:HAD family hydrolase [Sulfurospirillum arcachonense]
MYKAVIFDLDGTLLDTLKDIAISSNYVLEQYGKSPLPIEDFKLLVGKGASQLFIDLLPDLCADEHKKARALFEEHYAKQFDKNTKMYDDINKLLTFFQVRGYKMAVLSNKPNSFTKKCVLKYLRRWHFDAVYGIREGIPRKPDSAGADEILQELNIDANECLFVGDTKTDMQTAVNANLTPIGVLWGFREKKELLEHGAKFIVQKPSELIKLVVTMEILERDRCQK